MGRKKREKGALDFCLLSHSGTGMQPLKDYAQKTNSLERKSYLISTQWLKQQPECNLVHIYLLKKCSYNFLLKIILKQFTIKLKTVS